jgi:GNAT superfamily N-acetyltransferase
VIRALHPTSSPAEDLIVRTNAEKVELRTARREDKHSIVQIYLVTTGTDRTLDANWDRLIESGGFVVAEIADRIIGFGGIDVTAAEHLKWLYILPGYQSSGLGSKILQHLEKIGWRNGLERLRVHAAPGAVGFYERHGYERVAESYEIEHDHEGVEMVKSERTD